MSSNSGSLQAVLTSATQKGLTRRAVEVQNEARRLCRVDTGALRRSITFSITGSGTSMKATIGSNLDYSLAVETGTGIYGPKGSPIVPVHAQVLVFTTKTGTVFARSVRGRPATPYLKPALQKVMRAAA
jgi:hypothetical protein